MTNVALQWPAMQGVDMTPPDRIGNLAQLMADKSSRSERIAMAQRLEREHGRDLAEQVRDKAIEILRRRRGKY